MQFQLRAGVYLMRAVVREPDGLLGSADRRFTVRRLSGPSVSASDLVIDSSETQGLPVRPAVYRSEALSGVFELYGRSFSQLTDVSAERQSAEARRHDAHDVDARRARADPDESTAARAGPPASTCRSRAIPPGRYLVRSTVREGGETVADLLRDVVVEPGARPAPPPRRQSPSWIPS